MPTGLIFPPSGSTTSGSTTSGSTTSGSTTSGSTTSGSTTSGSTTSGSTTDSCYVCEPCKSAISKTAYLVDLIQFTIDCFHIPRFEDLENGLHRSLKKLVIDCNDSDKEVYQIEIANEILEKVILSLDTHLHRTKIYSKFRHRGYPKPGILDTIFDDYLEEFGTSRQEIIDAFTAASSLPPDRTKLNDLINRIGLTESDLKKLKPPFTKISIKQIDILPIFLIKSKTKDIDQNDPMQLIEYNTVLANAILTIDRIKEHTLVDLRANLIHEALLTINRTLPRLSIRNTDELGHYLFLDLSVSTCNKITRIEEAILAIQSFILGYQVGLIHIPNVDFDEKRWSWLQNYDAWKSAQNIFLYPENFMLPHNRRNISPDFESLIESVSDNPTSKSIIDAINEYLKSAPWEVSVKYACKFNDVLMLFGTRLKLNSENDPPLYVLELYCSTFDKYGNWSGWKKLSLSSDTQLSTQSINYTVGTPTFEGAVLSGTDFFLFFSNATNPPPAIPGQALAGVQYTLYVYKWDGNNDHNVVLEHQKTFSYPAGPTAYPIVTTIVSTGYLRLNIFIQIDQGQSIAHVELMTLISDGFWFESHLEQSYKSYLNIDTNYKITALGTFDYSFFFVVSPVSPNTIPQVSKLIDITNIIPGENPIVADLNSSISGLYYTNGFVKDKKIILVGLEPTNTWWNLITVTLNFNENDLTPARYTEVGRSSSDIHNDLIEIAIADNRMYVIGTDYISEYEEQNLPLLTYNLKGEYLHTLGHSYSQFDLLKNLITRPITPYSGRQIFDDYVDEQTRIFQYVKPSDLIWLYTEEYYFHIPLAVSDILNNSQFYQDADMWLRLLYNPFLPSNSIHNYGMIIYQPLKNPGQIDYSFRNTQQWLEDPFDPFTIARIRQGAFLRHVVFRYVENILDWADNEFIHDTNESINQARRLYELVQFIIQPEELLYDTCDQAWKTLMDKVYSSYPIDKIKIILVLLQPLQTDSRLKVSDIHKIQTILMRNNSFESNLVRMKRFIDNIEKRSSPAITLDDLNRELNECRTHELLAEETISSNTSISNLIGNIPVDTNPFSQLPSIIGCGFCILSNPLLQTFEARIETNLQKIQTCRNFVGMTRDLMIETGNIDLSMTNYPLNFNSDNFIPLDPPPLYRYSYLIERARYYVNVAQQLEASLLTSLQMSDAEQYSILKAKQDLQIARSNVELESLTVKEAIDHVQLTQAQIANSLSQVAHYSTLLTNGLSFQESEAIAFMYKAYALAYEEGQPDSVVNQYLGTLMQTDSSYIRRTEEWEYQKEQALNDVNIGKQNLQITYDKVDISTKEMGMAQMRNAYASDVLNFLERKFTNKQLYDWMSRLLKKYYRRHLDLATQIARMAQSALSFERQESLNFIAPYYSEQEKSDFLAAERLLTDINALDQNRLITAKRYQEVTKVISLAAVNPVEFLQLSKEGKMQFMTLMEWFDRDFPGQYMRLIKSISLTFIGLLPSVESIHAILSNNGISRVVTNSNSDESIVIRKFPETISITTPNDGTGLFTLNLDDPILLPFESNGVESAWTLELPKGANRFDYNNLIDIQFKIRYTSIYDLDYRDKILKKIGNTIQSTSAISFRNYYPDKWYHLNNPRFVKNRTQYSFNSGKINPPYQIQFELTPDDFPPNQLIQKMILLNIALNQEKYVKVPIEIGFQPTGTSKNYRIQTDYYWNPNDNLTSPLSITSLKDEQGVSIPVSNLRPFGTWTIKIKTDGTTNGHKVNSTNYPGLFSGKSIFHQKELDLSWLNDLLLVITYESTVNYNYVR